MSISTHSGPYELEPSSRSIRFPKITCLSKRRNDTIENYYGTIHCNTRAKHDITILLILGLYNCSILYFIKNGEVLSSFSLSAHGVPLDSGLGTSLMSLCALGLSLSRWDDYGKRSWLKRTEGGTKRMDLS